MESGGAQTMQSPSYQIESDSVNVGGARSTSTSYQLEDTAGEVATGPSSSDNFELRAGYQQMQDVFISLTQPDPVTLSPAIPGVSGGTSTGSTTLTVTTDNPAGYDIEIAATADPAMQTAGSAATIADYVPSGASDFTFTTASSQAHLGYNVVSSAAATQFINDGSSCGSGGLNTSVNCWDGLDTTGAVIASAGTANHPTGTDIVIHFQVGVGDNVVQPPGTYVATTTVTAIPL